MHARTPIDDTLLDELRAALSADRVACDPATTLVYSRDMWPRTLLDLRDGRPVVAPPPPTVSSLSRQARPRAARCGLDRLTASWILAFTV